MALPGEGLVGLPEGEGDDPDLVVSWEMGRLATNAGSIVGTNRGFYRRKYTLETNAT